MPRQSFRITRLACIHLQYAIQSALHLQVQFSLSHWVQIRLAGISIFLSFPNSVQGVIFQMLPNKTFVAEQAGCAN